MLRRSSGSGRAVAAALRRRRTDREPISRRCRRFCAGKEEAGIGFAAPPNGLSIPDGSPPGSICQAGRSRPRCVSRTSSQRISMWMRRREGRATLSPIRTDPISIPNMIAELRGLSSRCRCPSSSGRHHTTRGTEDRCRTGETHQTFQQIVHSWQKNKSRTATGRAEINGLRL